MVPVWNGRERLLRLLDKLAGQSHPIAEILVIDNGSTDGAPEGAGQQGARVLEMGFNAGFSRAVNRGVEACRTELVAIVNSDVEPAPDWLARLVEAMRDREVWFATGKTMQAADPHRVDGAYDTICRGACPWRAGSGRRDGPAFSSRRKIRLASATATVYRTELFRLVGGFDPVFESYLEDVDFSLRCACRGLGGVYVPEAKALHEGSASLGRWHADSVRRMARNQLYLVAKHYPPPLLLRFAWPILVAQGLWGLVTLRHGALQACLKGKWEGARNFSALRPRSYPDCDLSQLLRESEREIREVQRQTGFDWYWRLYFLLTTGGAN